MRQLKHPETLKDFDLVCFCHLRWDFVYQRPHHLMSRFARHGRVFFVEEPVYEGHAPRLSKRRCPKTGVHVVTPLLPAHGSAEQNSYATRRLLAELMEQEQIKKSIAWFYTPMALELAAELKPLATVYDCMDELSLFRGASPALTEKEQELFKQADVVFTGGYSLFEAKCGKHRNIYPFPSSVDVAHFAAARRIAQEPEDQAGIPHPRIGYVGVIDERVDLGLIAEFARNRPQWHIIMIGPTVKISPDTLPVADNIHYLGMKQYSDLPSYLSSWEVAMLPFALNEATRYISPTKTPEYLAAGLPVISTPIRDVIRPYGERGLVEIAGSASEFIAAADKILTYGAMKLRRRASADHFLSTLSWDNTWNSMSELVAAAVEERSNEPVRQSAASALTLMGNLLPVRVSRAAG